MVRTMILDPIYEFFAFHLDPDNYNYMSSQEIKDKYELRVSNFTRSFTHLRELMNQGDFQRNMVFDAAKPYYGEDKNALRDWFSDNNLLLFDKPEGPQLAKFIELIGVQEYQDKINGRLTNPITLFVWAKDKEK